MSPVADARSQQRLAAGGNARASAGRPGGGAGLDGGDNLRGLRVDGDVAALQHPADDLPGMSGRILRVGTPLLVWRRT
jgi:hypothetical protein